jgi:hypothetical protein
MPKGLGFAPGCCGMSLPTTTWPSLCRVSYVQRHLPLVFLFPDIVEVIVAERQPRFWMLGDLIAARRVASGCLGKPSQHPVPFAG